MIDLVAIRDDLVPVLQGFSSAFPAVPVLYPNGPFDRDNPPEQYVEIEIVNYAGEQINLGANPATRLRGYVYVTAWTKQGLGTREGAAHLSWFANALKYRSSPVLQLQAPEPDGTSDPTGWYGQHIKVAFHCSQG